MAILYWRVYRVLGRILLRRCVPLPVDAVAALRRPQLAAGALLEGLMWAAVLVQLEAEVGGAPASSPMSHTHR